MQYRDLNHALTLLKSQVLEGIPYAKNNLPQFTDPEKVFNFLKLRTKYKNDPQGVELFQTLPTLLDNNFHGITGHGDCDCFSIALLTVLAANNFKNFGVVLCGRNRWTPAHIYVYVIDENGTKTYLDLTNKIYNYERFYPYKQEIKFTLTPKDKKNMLLQLADNQQTSPYSGYIWLPSKGIQMREDLADDLNGADFQRMLLNEGYSLSEIEQLAGRRRQRKQEKHDAKMEKRKAKTEIKKARAEKKRAKGEAAKTRAEAKRLKGENSGGGDAVETGKDIFGTVVGGASQLVGAWRGNQQGGGEESAGGGAAPQDTAPTKRTKDESSTVNILGMEMSKTTAIISAIGLVAVVGGGIYMATRPKRQAA